MKANETIGQPMVEAILRGVPAEDTHTCLKIGSALKNEFGENGHVLFSEFCAKASNYEPNWVAATWKSVKPEKAGIGLLLTIAREHGAISAAGASGNHASPGRPQFTQREESASKKAIAQDIWQRADKSDAAVCGHAYAITKQIPWAAGAGRGVVSGRQLGQRVDCLIIPITDIASGNLQGVECINALGKKQAFGVKSGGALVLGDTSRKDVPWSIVEGWASTVACCDWFKRDPVVCAFGKHAMDAVAKAIALHYRPAEIHILKENDA